MCTEQIVRNALIGMVLGFACVAFLDAQKLPAPLAGPASDSADYAYLSFVTARNIQSGALYELHYDLCNRRTRKMAFVWEDVGFGMDFSDPLPGGLCATYELSGFGFKPKPATTLRFSSGSQSVPAYLPCANKVDCAVGVPPTSQVVTAVFTAILSKLIPSQSTPNRPASVLSPLRVVVREINTPAGNRRVQVDWTGSDISFLAHFPGSKLGVDDLKQMVASTNGAKFEFNTFPALKNADFILGASTEYAAIKIEPNSSAQFGTWVIELSAKVTIPQLVRLIVLDGQNKPIARLDPPFPTASR